MNPSRQILQPLDPIEPTPPSAIGQELPAEPQESPGSGIHQKEPSPLLVRVVRDDSLSNFEKKSVRIGGIGVVVSFLAFVAAGIGAFLVYQQFAEMNQQTGIMDRSAKQARIDSATAAVTTKQQIGLLQSQINQQWAAMRLDQRAWLGLATAMPPPLFHGDTRSLKVVISNTGKTPALAVYHREGIVQIPRSEKIDAAGRLKKKAWRFAGTIAPGGTRDITASAPTDQQLAKLSSGEEKFYFVASFTFKDIGKKAHHLHICLRLDMPYGPFEAEGPYNDAD